MSLCKMRFSSEPAFFDLIKRMLIKQGYEVTHESSGILDFGLDLIVRKDGIRIGVDLKFYRTKNVYSNLVATALTNLKRGMEDSQISQGILIVSCNLQLGYTNLEQGIQLWGRADLIDIATQYPEFQAELASLLEITSDELSGLNPIVLPVNSSIDIRDFFDVEIVTNPGLELISKLEALEAGRDSAYGYEALGREIFDYLFESDLEGWYSQLTTADGLNRYDYVCRIKGMSAFWHFLLHNLNSRYLVVEFKNYSAKIDQGQVLTTEKYLLENALRKFAIISSREGASESALKMAQGAMRESGKLILILSDEDLKVMLRKKASGSDPSDHLFDQVDDFLLKLPR